MLNKYKYKNKIRYHFREKKEIILLWENNDKNNKKEKVIREKWSKNIFYNNNKINNVLLKSAKKRFNYLKEEKLKERKEKNWMYNTTHVWRKKPFISYDKNRKEFWNNIINCIKKEDSLYFIKNNLYNMLDNNTSIYKNLNVLNFTWLFETKNKKKDNENIENFMAVALKFIYKGFLLNGLKLQCEKKLIELLILLKKNIKKGGLQIMLYFIQKLKPVLGFKRKRIGRVSKKKKETRYFYKLYHHNWRWQSLILKRLLFNSPFYSKRTKVASVTEIYKGLMQALESKGPIVKGLISYYKLIGKRTPNATRKKKKKRKGRNIK